MCLCLHIPCLLLHTSTNLQSEVIRHNTCFCRFIVEWRAIHSIPKLSKTTECRYKFDASCVLDIGDVASCTFRNDAVFVVSSTASRLMHPCACVRRCWRD